jgi:hypothetical protein
MIVMVVLVVVVAVKLLLNLFEMIVTDLPVNFDHDVVML